MPAPSPDAYMAALEHPFKPQIERLRDAIRALDPRITESVKWNAPSFALVDHFATFRLHPPRALQLVLHTGAKPPPVPRAFALDDPHGLLAWAAPDRCVITLASAEQADARHADVVALVRAWIAQLPGQAA